MTKQFLVTEGSEGNADFFHARPEFSEFGSPLSLADIKEAYDLLVEITDDSAKYELNGRRPRVGFIVRDLRLLKRLRARNLPGDILFAPSRLAVLDALATERMTLVAARHLVRGTTVKQADLATEKNGAGVGATFLTYLIGRELAYDIDAGSPIDYGVVI